MRFLVAAFDDKENAERGEERWSDVASGEEGEVEVVVRSDFLSTV